jgi:hypothetical protein
VSCIEKYCCDRCKKEINKEDIFNKIEQKLELDQFSAVRYEVDITSKLFVSGHESNEPIDFCRNCAREIFLEIAELLNPYSKPPTPKVYEYYAVYSDGTVEKRNGQIW